MPLATLFLSDKRSPWTAIFIAPRPPLALLSIALLTLALLLLALPAGCQRSTPATSVVTQEHAQRIDEESDDRTNIVAAPKETRFDGLPGDRPNAESTRRPIAGPPPAPIETIAEPIEEPADGGQVVEDTWDAYYFRGSRVGYAHTTVATVEEGGQPLQRTRSATRTSFKRSGQTIVQDILLTSWERPDGELVRCESRMKMGPSDMVSKGRVAEGQLVIETTTLGRAQSQTIAWQQGTGGFFVVEQSLKQKPLRAGEKRSVTGLMPVFNMVGTTELAAGDYETVKLPLGDVKLLKVQSVIELGQQKLETVLWIDEKGQTLKSLVPALGQEAVRTTEEDALQQPTGEGFDLLVASVVRLKEPLANPLATKRVVYRATVKSGKIDGLFSGGLSQRVKVTGERTAELTVLALRPGVPASVDARQAGPDEQDLAANNLIQSDDARIVEMAAKAAPSSDDPWEIAVALEKQVARTIQKKNFSQAFATAAEVARSMEGDCTEHAVLLAALCRARKIPARTAFGLVYYPPEQGFAYHMWNEVWLGDRWVPLDGTLGLGGIGADHIKLGDSNLNGTTGLAAMLPVVQVFGQLELEVISAE